MPSPEREAALVEDVLERPDELEGQVLLLAEGGGPSGRRTGVGQGWDRDGTGVGQGWGRGGTGVGQG